MITFKDFLEITQYGITDTSPYMWKCYGDRAQIMDCWDGDLSGISASIILDLNDQSVYEVTIIDYKKNNAYRYIDPLYKQRHLDEAKERNVPHDQAYDDVCYVDIDDAEKFLERMKAITNGDDYDDRVIMKIDFPEDLLFELMTIAHEKDITLNQLINQILREHIDARA